MELGEGYVEGFVYRYLSISKRDVNMVFIQEVSAKNNGRSQVVYYNESLVKGVAAKLLESSTSSFVRERKLKVFYF